MKKLGFEPRKSGSTKLPLSNGHCARPLEIIKEEWSIALAFEDILNLFGKSKAHICENLTDKIRHKFHINTKGKVLLTCTLAAVFRGGRDNYEIWEQKKTSCRWELICAMEESGSLERN